MAWIAKNNYKFWNICKIFYYFFSQYTFVITMTVAVFALYFVYGLIGYLSAFLLEKKDNSFRIAAFVIMSYVNNSNHKDKFLNRKKFVMFRISSVIIILSLPFLFSNYGIPIVISSLITGICGFNIVHDIKYHSNHRNKL